MKKQIWKKGLALVMGLVLGIQGPAAGLIRRGEAYAYQERSATVNASTLNVRSGAGTGYASVAKLGKGTSVTVINETTGSDGQTWYQIRFTSGGSAQTGYVLGTYVRFPVNYSYNQDFESFLNSQGFPESYKDGLRQLHAQYPNWIFEAQQTGLDWNTVIQNESVLPRSLIHTSSISSYKSLADGAYDWDNSTWTGFDGSSWVAASEDIIRYYMDPRNFLDDVYVFQFMNHEYDSTTQTREGLQALVKGTFLDGAVIQNGSASGGGSPVSGSSGSSGGPVSGSSGGPGVSGSGSGVITSGGSQSSGGPGVSGSGGGSAGSSAPSGDGGVRLQGPVASISRHDTDRLTASANVVVGRSPGSGGQAQDSGAVQSGSPVQGGGSPQASGSVQAGSSVPSAGPQSGSSGTGSSPVVQGGGSPSSPDVSGSGSGALTYVDMIMNAAQASGVNPYVLTAMIIQEQGSDGRGNSIKGNNSSYPGYYNYFNVGAYAADGMGAVERGLWYASQSGSYGRPWNTPEKAIIGGAQFYGDNYVKAGQDTFYLKKYNVQGSNLYKHQYMTNVDGAAAEGSIFAESYSSKVKSLPLRFKIPVYTGMPDSPCVKPTGDGSPNNKLRALGVEGFNLTPTFSRDTYSYDLIVDHSVGAVNVYANAIDSKAGVSGTGTIQLASGINEIQIMVQAENGSQRMYQIHVVRQSNGPTYNSGIGGGSGGGAVTPGGTVTPGGGTVSAGSGGPGISSGGSAGPGGSSGPGGGPGGSGSSQSGAPTPGGSNVIVIQ